MGSSFAKDAERHVEILAPMPCLEKLALFGNKVHVRISGKQQPRRFFVTGVESVTMLIGVMDSFVAKLEEICSRGALSSYPVLQAMQITVDPHPDAGGIRHTSGLCSSLVSDENDKNSHYYGSGYRR